MLSIKSKYDKIKLRQYTSSTEYNIWITIKSFMEYLNRMTYLSRYVNINYTSLMHSILGLYCAGIKLIGLVYTLQTRFLLLKVSNCIHKAIIFSLTSI